jgi:hypothetical protein
MISPSGLDGSSEAAHVESENNTAKVKAAPTAIAAICQSANLPRTGLISQAQA